MRAWVPFGALLLALSPLLVLRPVFVDGRSMEPGLKPGSLRVALRAWILPAPQRGEIWLVRTREGDMLKRVVGLPGERLEQRDGLLWQGGRLLEEPYLHRHDAVDGGPWECGEGYFVAGDNRRDSRDSRAFGPLPRAAFRGRLLAP